MPHAVVEYRVHLTACLQSDVLAICTVLRRILANEHSSHSVSRPPIFSSGIMQMAQELLQNVHDNNASTETVHVLPGSHNMCFKLHFENEYDSGGASYRITFRYRDKRAMSSAIYHTDKTRNTSKHCRGSDSANIDAPSESKRSKRFSWVWTKRFWITTFERFCRLKIISCHWALSTARW